MRRLMAVAAVLAAFGASGAAHAQREATVEQRVGRLESEMRAVQRKVFPGGAGMTVEPQITPETDTSVPGTPASSPVADLTQRVAALESQLATLTGQVEQLGYRVRQDEDAFSGFRAALEPRLKAIEDRLATLGPAASTASAPAEVPVEAAIEPPTTRPRPTPVATTPAATTPAATTPKPTSTRAQQVAAVQRPATGDAAEDGYVYGFRLWQAKFYPEARKELEAVVANFPTHRRASFAKNLVGRAYLDAGAPALAAKTFYDNYKLNPNGERAPDSLFYLAKALVALKKPPADVCRVYDELTQLYGDKISEEMKAGVTEGRASAKCK